MTGKLVSLIIPIQRAFWLSLQPIEPDHWAGWNDLKKMESFDKNGVRCRSPCFMP